MAGFDAKLFKFLGQLKRNNNRPWFDKNRQRYEDEVRQPALAFIRAMEPRLKKLSPHFVASDKKVGGSLMRVHRDTRFAKDKTPYKTNVGIQFRHEMGKDVHAPGFYLHLDPKECFLGVGLWHPEADALKKIRTSIADNSAQWKRAKGGKKLQVAFSLAGDSLKTAPKGFDKEHPLIEDLRRKDFIAVHSFSSDQARQPNFDSHVATEFATSKPFIRFLCNALPIPF